MYVYMHVHMYVCNLCSTDYTNTHYCHIVLPII